MSKQKTVWCCNECGHNQAKWSGQCKECSQWNTFHEEQVFVESRFETSPKNIKPIKIKDVDISDQPRIICKIQELDRLLGGGVVKGSLILVGGEPGIGKSTLMLQLVATLADQGLTILYVCGEESVAQTTLRARRLKIDVDNNLYLFSETNFSLIKREVEMINPDVLVIDSIQILYKTEILSAPGSVSQVRECGAELMHLAKTKEVATFIIGHVTKSGEIAGPRVLEHLVDTVLYFEGESEAQFRIMRAIKNRFGPTDEIAVFQMTPQGLTQVENPSKFFLEERRENYPGSVIIPTVEGSRPILVEVQALVVDSAFATPTRRSSGIDPNRCALLLAVMEKKGGYLLSRSDVFVSVAGGMRIVEPAVDLAVMVAIASSLKNRAIKPSLAVFGEVGLGGEVRMGTRGEQRLRELIQMGFKTCILPKRSIKGLSEQIQNKICLIGVEKLEEGIDAALH